jgi:hypothetical protein
VKRIIFAVLAAGALAAVVATPAEASGGCGPYRHRTYWGACRPPGEWGWPRGGYGYGPPPVVVPFFGWGGPWGWHRHYW